MSKNEKKKNTIATVIVILILFMMYVGSNITSIRNSTDEQVCMLGRELDEEVKKLKSEIEELRSKVEYLERRH